MGDVRGERRSITLRAHGAISSLPQLDLIPPEMLSRAESLASQIVKLVQPTVESEQERTDVIKYVRKLIGTSLGNEVVAFGSVPLKTFLPDGDIDLTALGDSESSGSGGCFAQDVLRLLESEEHNLDAEFDVKDVKFISAEVQLVKCLIQNIIVDISFNQSGGLCTLCFLELVDGHIGKDHLFKRSIILVKTWCYYESRILGAHHGLFSTYALETLILYIFNLFHKSLDGPLAVLYRFLEYFSKFDWEKYCISLYGPVKLTTLPKLDVEDIDSNDLLLTKEHVKNILASFSLPPMNNGVITKQIPAKCINIIDPLKENNNLGRSVSKSSYYRIKSACAYGARKLGNMLMSSPDRIPDEISLFFKNTLQRSSTSKLSDLEDQLPDLNVSNDNSDAEPPFVVTDLTGDLETNMTALRQVQLHLEDHFVGFSTLQNGPEFSNGSWTDTPVSSSGSTEEHLRPSLLSHEEVVVQNPNNMNINNGLAWDPHCQHQGKYFYGPPQVYSNQCYFGGGADEFQWKQAREYEMAQYNQQLQIGTSAYSGGVVVPVAVPVSGGVVVPASPGYVNEDFNQYHGTGTYFPAMNYNVVRNNNNNTRRPYGNFRKQGTSYNPSRSRNHHNNNIINNNNSTHNRNRQYRGTNVNSNNDRTCVRRDNRGGSNPNPIPNPIPNPNTNTNPSPSIVTEQKKPVVTGMGTEDNGSSSSTQPKVEFGSTGPVAIKEPEPVPEVCKTYEQVGPSKEKNKKLKSPIKEDKVSVPLVDSKTKNWAKAAKRGAGPYQLKSEGDFPPLSSG